MAGSGRDTGSRNGDTDRTVDHRQDREQLHLVVIGAGLAGLAAAISTRLEAGHRVTVLEKVQKIEEIGAGLQVTPNATRLFQRWGIYDELAANAATPTYLAVRRYDGTRLLARDDKFQDKILDKYGSPFWDLHRTDVQIALVRRAESLGVEIRLGAEVVDIDSSNGTVTTAAGDVVQGDIVQGADGLWSRSRSLFLGRQVNPHPTGDIAYRIILHADDIQDQELKELVSKPSVNFWAGPKSHVVGYSIRNGRVYNLVLLTPDDLPEHVSRAAANVEEMRRLFEDWDPILKRLLACVNSVDKWRLMHMAPLDSWTSADGRFFLSGDACHPMLPYLAQGANSSLEDGAVLGRLLSYVKHEEQIKPAVKMYESLRKIRGEAIAQESMKQRESFHMEDGPQQVERDAIFEAALGQDDLPSPFPSRWTCPAVQPWLYDYDAAKEADKAFSENPF